MHHIYIYIVRFSLRNNFYECRVPGVGPVFSGLPSLNNIIASKVYFSQFQRLSLRVYFSHGSTKSVTPCCIRSSLHLNIGNILRQNEPQANQRSLTNTTTTKRQTVWNFQELINILEHKQYKFIYIYEYPTIDHHISPSNLSRHILEINDLNCWFWSPDIVLLNSFHTWISIQNELNNWWEWRTQV